MEKLRYKSFNGCRLDGEINKWLEDNPNAVIFGINQSITMGGNLIVSVWYVDKKKRRKHD